MSRPQIFVDPMGESLRGGEENGSILRILWRPNARQSGVLSILRIIHAGGSHSGKWGRGGAGTGCERRDRLERCHDGGMSDNVAGMLAYVTIIPAIIFLAIEPFHKNRFIRFH